MFLRRYNYEKYLSICFLRLYQYVHKSAQQYEIFERRILLGLSDLGEFFDSVYEHLWQHISYSNTE
jgi:hypothetical protein